MVGLGGAVTGTPAADGRETKQALWDEFCRAHHIADAGVPSFSATPDGTVEIFAHERDRRFMLCRSAAMEDLLTGTVEQVLAAEAAVVEGVLYLMHRLDAAGRIVPLYIGKAGRYGRTGGVSANLANIRGNGTMFSRRGYNYAYHMGDLSAAALPGRAPVKVVSKYKRWAARLFKKAPAAAPRLRAPVRFWCTGWGPHSPSIWTEFGGCPLAFAEYLLIGLAGLLFPVDLLSEEGVNRVAAVAVSEA